MPHTIIAQAAATPAATGPMAAIMNFAPIIAIFGVFYFLLIRPQQKQQKLVKQMIKDAKRGDKVVLTSGMHGTINEVRDNTVRLAVASGVEVEFDKTAIGQVLGYGAK